jgi:hypothetical protein
MNCELCEEEIEPKRVAAFNGKVKFCIYCQQEREKSGEFRRHSMTTKTEFAVGGEIEALEDTIVRSAE